MLLHLRPLAWLTIVDIIKGDFLSLFTFQSGHHDCGDYSKEKTKADIYLHMVTRWVLDCLEYLVKEGLLFNSSFFLSVFCQHSLCCEAQRDKVCLLQAQRLDLSVQLH